MKIRIPVDWRTRINRASVWLKIDGGGLQDYSDESRAITFEKPDGSNLLFEVLGNGSVEISCGDFLNVFPHGSYVRVAVKKVHEESPDSNTKPEKESP